MNALHQIVSSSNGVLSIQVPTSYQSQKFEVIVFPLENNTEDKDSQRLEQAHKIIDAGGSKNLINFLAEFEQSKQDRVLPLRD